MRLKLFGWELEFRRETPLERLEMVVRERKTGFDSEHSRVVEAEMARLWKALK